MKKENFYITTPIYYPNSNLHIGHAYCTVATDTMARYKKMRGFDVLFLTGTDEHGQKLENAAKEKGLEPLQYIDIIVEDTKKLWEKLGIEYDIFYRTTDEKHKKAVQKIFKKLYDQGDIYKGFYEDLYCTPCESFFTSVQAKDNICPDCNRPVTLLKEEAYFFKLSKYEKPLREHIEKNPKFIWPQSRKNEMIKNFIDKGLEDICVSRTTFKWGIPVDFDLDHVVYVWIDALSSYITALGFLGDDDTNYKKYWPAGVHVIGKEIVRFHTIIWPAILMALGEPLPLQVFGHGWLLIDSEKMSKSKGNVVDPSFLVDRYGVSAIRYFLLREIAFGQDGNFTNEILIQRINHDLANDLGNLLSRTVSMIEKYFENGILQTEQEAHPLDKELQTLSLDVVQKVEGYMDNMHFSDALATVWTLISRANKYIDETTPWIIAKDKGNTNILANIMYQLCEVLRKVSILIESAMEQTSKDIRTQLNIDPSICTWDSARQIDLLPRDIRVSKGQIIFPRIDLNQELEFLANQKNNGGLDKEETTLPIIEAEEFFKVELKIGEVIACEKMPKSEKLLKSQIKIGSETRQILSGIAKHYSPEDMIGKKVVVVTNLKPRKMMGQMSEGMILAASDSTDELLSLVTIDKDIDDGAVVS